MPLLASSSQLRERARLATIGDLGALASSLAADLQPLVEHEPEIPLAKAWLSRTGGRCARDGAMLDFDPFQPHEHRCPRCGERYRGELHDRWWVTWRQLWLAERAVHAALLALVRPEGAAAHGALADSLLARYAELYASYPNEDNALGPTRPFFSTYLESIWLLQLAVALDLREAAGSSFSLGGRVRDTLVAPSARLIAGFDEGTSNRQVWHNAALLAAGRLLGDQSLVERAAFGPSGLTSHLAGGLLADGSWYEGENYHLFAHRGLWYGVQLCAAAGIELPTALLARFTAGFTTPFLTALPDLTFPARRDSQYAVSLRQWRFAELAELGLARGDDPRLHGALAALYAPDVPRADPGRWRSTAEAERNEPESRLTRADLGWRSLLFARAALPPLEASPARSALLAGQGLAVFRRDGGRLYAALDYGHSGGGHGHPDRLNLLVALGVTRWLDDAGTGSYVDPSLHWYRSTLAHNAPLVNGRSQLRTNGELAAYEERPAAGWADALVRGVAEGVELRRALVVLDDYLVSELSWRAPAGTQIDLPVHVDGEVTGVAGWQPASAAPDVAVGAEDGWPFVARTERAHGAAFGDPVRIAAVRAGNRASLWLLAPAAAELWRGVAPGPPGADERRFHFVRVRAAKGRLLLVCSWRAAVAAVATGDGGAIAVDLADGTRHEHRRTAEGWQIGLRAGGASSSIDLAGTVPTVTPDVPGAAAARTAPAPRAPLRVPRRSGQCIAVAAGADAAAALDLDLAEPHYRRSELLWHEAGEPAAAVELWAEAGRLVVRVRVRNVALAFAPAQAANPLDNEHPDTNTSGVQLYVRGADKRTAAWILVPEPQEGRVRVTPASQDALSLAIETRWHATGANGYELCCAVPLAPFGAHARLDLDLIVNETVPGRERRRGQLVLSGGAGEFVYLRGDRQPAERFIPLVIDDV